MTKIMTLIIIMEELKENRLNLDEIVTTSEHAASMGGSQIYLEKNEQMSVEDLLKSVAIVSANDGAVALAEKIAGTETVFVKMMNDKAKELGLSNTVFKNVTGLPDDGHYSTTMDMALMGRHLLINYPEITEYINTYEDYIRNNEFWLVNTNKLIRNENIDGIKTGWTEEAGYCLTASMFNDKIRVIGSLMGNSSSKIRNNEMLTLLNYGVANYKVIQEISKDTVVRSETDFYHSPKIINYKIKRDVNFILRKNENIDSVEYEIKLNHVLDDVIGELYVYLDGNLTDKIELYSTEKIEKNNFLQFFKNILLQFVN